MCIYHKYMCIFHIYVYVPHIYVYILILEGEGSKKDKMNMMGSYLKIFVKIDELFYMILIYITRPSCDLQKGFLICVWLRLWISRVFIMSHWETESNIYVLVGFDVHNEHSFSILEQFKRGPPKISRPERSSLHYFTTLIGSKES